MVIYEWKDVKYLGRVTSETDDSLPVSDAHTSTRHSPLTALFNQQKTYVCTTDAVRSGLCSYENIGRFIFGTEDPNDHTVMSQTSFWTASVALNQTGVSQRFSSSPLWETENNPTPPPEKYTSPWLRGFAPVEVHVIPRADEALNPSPSGMLAYTSPIQYQVRKTGYYCAGKLNFRSLARLESHLSL
jgi:hypothetical protein